jgi:hypothetical protein
MKLAFVLLLSLQVLGLAWQAVLWRQMSGLRAELVSDESRSRGAPASEGRAAAGARVAPAAGPAGGQAGDRRLDAAPAVTAAEVKQLAALEVERTLEERQQRAIRRSADRLGNVFKLAPAETSELVRIMEEHRSGKQQLLDKLAAGEVNRAELLEPLAALEEQTRGQMSRVLGNERLDQVQEFLRQHPEFVGREFLGFRGRATERTSLSQTTTVP